MFIFNDEEEDDDDEEGIGLGSKSDPYSRAALHAAAASAWATEPSPILRNPTFLNTYKNARLCIKCKWHKMWKEVILSVIREVT